MDYDRQFTTYGQVRPARVNQQGILPTAIQPAQLAQTNLVNTTTDTLGPFVLVNGDSVTVRSILTNRSNPNFRLGGAPYGILFFQGTLDTDNIIGVTVGTGNYIINGPLAAPVFTPVAAGTQEGGSDGDNLVYYTELINKSGSTQTVYAAINSRVFNPIGGGTSI